MPKKKCWTKPKKDGGTYTTCKEGQDKSPKKKTEEKKKIKFRVKPKEEEKKEEKPKKRVFHVREKAKAKPANKPQHAKVIEPKKRVANVAKVIPATVKPKQSIGKSLTGLSHEQMNKLSPLELFGMLPVGVSSKHVLNPKATGVKVAQDPRKQYHEESRKLNEEMSGYEDSVDAELKSKFTMGRKKPINDYIRSEGLHISDPEAHATAVSQFGDPFKGKGLDDISIMAKFIKERRLVHMYPQKYPLMRFLRRGNRPHEEVLGLKKAYEDAKSLHFKRKK